MSEPKKRKKKRLPTWMRDLLRRAAPKLIVVIYRLIAVTLRQRQLIGAEHTEKLLETGEPFLPCYWHQQSVFCIEYLLKLMRDRELKVGFLVSPSKDGEIGAKMLNSLGAHVIRGSSSRTGTQALRDVYLTVKKEKITIAGASDGPRGPALEFKPGWLMLARVTGAPLLPIAYACDRYWKFNSWDQFIVPKPFARLVIVIGEPIWLETKTSNEALEALQPVMAERLNALSEVAQEALRTGS